MLLERFGCGLPPGLPAGWPRTRSREVIGGRKSRSTRFRVAMGPAAAMGSWRRGRAGGAAEHFPCGGDGGASVRGVEKTS